MTDFSKIDVGNVNNLTSDTHQKRATVSKAEPPVSGAAMETKEKTKEQGTRPQPAALTADQASVRSIDLSHDALALRMGIAGFDENARYVAAWGAWLFWDNMRWQKDETEAFIGHTRDYLRMEADNLISAARREARKLEKSPAARLVKWAQEQAENLKQRATIVAVASLTRSNWTTATKPDEFDKDLLLMGTPDGTVDLKSGLMKPAEQDDMITKLTACGPAAPGSSPTLWLKFLNRVFADDQEAIGFMKRAAGYALTGLTTEHKLLFLYGGGRNGKSVFLDTLMWLLGDYARSASSSLLLAAGQNQHPTGLAGLQGARLVTASEIPRNATWNEAIIKGLTGGETISARYMRGDFFDFKPQMTLMIAGNDKPRLNGVDKAMMARVVLVPFDVFIPEEERDPNLAVKLKEEGPQILRWAIEGALEWQKRGLDVPATIRKASLSYLDDEDVLQSFLDEETTSSSSNCVKTQDLYDRYRDWCQRQGTQPEKRATFTKDLMGRGFQETKRNTGKVFHGLSLLETVPD